MARGGRSWSQCTKCRAEGRGQRELSPSRGHDAARLNDPQNHVQRPIGPLTHQTNLLQAWQGGRRQVIPSDQDMFVRLPLKCGARYGIARCGPETSRQYAGQDRRRERSTDRGGGRGNGASWVIQPAGRYQLRPAAAVVLPVEQADDDALAPWAHEGRAAPAAIALAAPPQDDAPRRRPPQRGGRGVVCAGRGWALRLGLACCGGGLRRLRGSRLRA